ncbi:hypothetical protein KUTeg_016970 [Tegillarca granosa]|uniref:acetate--CoA ligase n=1 Tax=Tegillarca granosa TaxID=220873 RepID=A0ABQ9EMM6_TEGGR|nr:hypothetical protein KUTeg_016970 [Tegillarca granosa]
MVQFDLGTTEPTRAVYCRRNMADAQDNHGGLLFPPIERIQKEAHISSFKQYEDMYKQSIEDPESFWKEIAKQFYWKSEPTGKFFDYNFDSRKGPIFIKWMEGATTNICYNALDRNIDRGLGSKIAFHWEGNNPEDGGHITFNKLYEQVCKFSNVLKSMGLKKGDRVAIYMPMIIELVVALLACARIGVIHSIVFAGYSIESLEQRLVDSQAKILVAAELILNFAGFSSESLAERILDASCRAIITSDGVWRGNKLLNLKHIVDEAIIICEKRGHKVERCIVVRHLSPSDEIITEDGDGDCTTESPAKRPSRQLKIQWSDRDSWWHKLMELQDAYVFDYQPDDIYWCTADVGWITGHTYVCYGPLNNGATGIIFEGVPFYPDAGRFWQIVDKYKVTKFYTAPTAIRALMKFGDDFVTRHKRTSLKILGTVGEPINPEAWLWYYNVVGNKRCAVVDTFWQTETGGHVITPLPGATVTKPGSATFPFFGIVPALLDEEGKEITEAGKEGYLVFKQPWPGIMRTVFGNHERFETTYFKKFHGYYCTGDGAKKDADGYIWVTGRIDDMVNVSGHLLSTAEIESALVEHAAVSEAAVVSHPHKIKGECTYCFVTLKEGFSFSKDLSVELKNKVREKIGPFAQPDFVQEAPGLPKTRSGKIMRRILRKIAVGDKEVGDISTLADETVIDKLFQLRPADA